jgi:hypothetical protein
LPRVIPLREGQIDQLADVAQGTSADRVCLTATDPHGAILTDD